MEVLGLEELKQRLRDPAMFAAAMRVFGARAARTGKSTAVRAIDGGTGVATQSIVSLVFPYEGAVTVKTMIPRARALSIEEGRAPGNPPPLGAVIAWAEAVGHGDNPRDIRAEIRARGARGKGFLAQVKTRWQASIPRWLEEAAARIEKRWAQGKR